MNESVTLEEGDGECNRCFRIRQIYCKKFCKSCYNYLNKDRVKQTEYYKKWKEKNPDYFKEYYQNNKSKFKKVKNEIKR